MNLSLMSLSLMSLSLMSLSLMSLSLMSLSLMSLCLHNERCISHYLQRFKTSSHNSVAVMIDGIYIDVDSMLIINIPL